MRPRPLTVSRRVFLRGAGAALSLPFLESLARALPETKKAKPPVRMAAMYFPNGMWKDAWIPKAAGAEFELPFSLEPLGDLKKDVLIVSNLDKKHSHGGDGHYAKTANFLTGLHVTKTTGKEISVGGISIDQLAATKLGNQTPLPSLELGIDPVISGIDSIVGYTRLYGSYISWRSANVPLAREINPRLVYERLFGTKASGSKRDDDKSLLDLTLEDANGLRKKLGRDDQFKLDEYLDSVRAVEKQIDFAAKPDERDFKPMVPSSELKTPKDAIPADHREHVKLMFDLMVLAFWSDSTRIATFMFANDVSGKNFSFLDGVKGGHHDMSHHANEPGKIDQYKKIVRWHVEQYAYMLNRLKAIKEGESNVLDNSMILMGSSFSDGNAHDPNNLPILLGGRAGGALKPGRHIAAAKNTPLCNLYVSMLDKMGIKAPSFGDSTGTLKDIDG